MVEVADHTYTHSTQRVAAVWLHKWRVETNTFRLCIYLVTFFSSSDILPFFCSRNPFNFISLDVVLHVVSTVLVIRIIIIIMDGEICVDFGFVDIVCY